MIPLVLAFAVLGWLAWVNGGYFAESWGWLTLGLLLMAATILVSIDGIRISRISGIYLVALATFGAWIAISTSWSLSAPRTVVEGQRSLLYFGAALAVILVTTQRHIRGLLGGVLLATVATAAYALGSRVLADGSAAEERLAGSIGYWNALGIFAVVGILLAIGFTVDRTSGQAVRSLAAVSHLILVPALYLTYGRGAWIALLAGLGVLVLVGGERTRVLLAVATLVPLWGATVLAVRELDGIHLAAAGVLLATALGQTSRVVDRLVDRARVPTFSSRRTVAAAAVVVAALLALLSTWVIGDVYAGFRSSVPAEGGLDRRLISLSGSGRAEYWAVAWNEYTSHPFFGTGAGTFELAWNRERSTNFGARDAHNVYLEALTELGPIGLTTLCVVLLIPLVGLLRTPRRSPLLAAGAGAYVAVWLHASVDWDWEMPAVTIAALVCGCALVNSAPGRGRDMSGTLRAVLLLACVSLTGFAFVGAVGNGAIAGASAALARGDVARAERDAKRATVWAPWSSDGWRLLGEARVRRGRISSGRAALIHAIERDPNDWLPWSSLFDVSRGQERLRALDMVARLNPRSIGLRPAEVEARSGN